MDEEKMEIDEAKENNTETVETEPIETTVNETTETETPDSVKKDTPTAREARRNKKLEEAETAMIDKTSRPKKKKPEKLTIDKEKIKKPVLIICAILLLLIFTGPIVRMVNNNGNPNQPTGLLLLTDMTGYTETDAINKIHDIGFVNIKKEYIFDQFTQDGCVIKTNHHINSELKPNEEIIVYICDKNLVEIKEEKGKDSYSQETERTYFTMDGITVIDMAIKDNVFFAILKNNNSQAIKNIQYRIGYQNPDGSDIGENRYNLDSDFTVLPGEKFRIEMDIRNSNAYYIYISGLTYEKIAVPAEERN